MIAERLVVADAQIDSVLGRISPVVKLGVALLWLVGLALTLHPLPPVLLAGVALAAGLTLGGIPPRSLGRTLAPVWLAALTIGLSNMLFSAANGQIPMAGKTYTFLTAQNGFVQVDGEDNSFNTVPLSAILTPEIA